LSIDGLVETKVRHPSVFLVLLFPFGASSGFIVVTLGYILAHHGVSVAAIAALIAIGLVPQTWKFLWAPIVDTVLTRKTWYLIGTLLMGATIAAAGLVPIRAGSLPILTFLVVASSVASTINGMATESLAANTTDPKQKGRAAGWLQAGNLGGQGVGGGAALWIAQHSGSDALAMASLGALCAACCLALFFVGEGPRERTHASYGQSVIAVVKDVFSVAKSRTGFLAIVILVMPIGTGAAGNLWAAVAGDWHASADLVALVNGALGGVVAMIACLIGGYLCDVMDRKVAYALFGTLIALCAVAMALAPRTPLMFVTFTIAYGFILGLCYSAFCAVTLEAIGGGAAATKYNLLASLSNAPIACMTYIEGIAQTRYGSAGMLYTEAGVGVLATAVFGLLALALNRILVPAAAAA
jgi:PAT family beta-lactamase induction signal transducer AmpG